MSELTTHFDYLLVAICEHGVKTAGTELVSCGEPATYELYWEETTDGLKVCQEHFDIIAIAEHKEITGEDYIPETKRYKQALVEVDKLLNKPEPTPEEIAARFTVLEALKES